MPRIQWEVLRGLVPDLIGGDALVHVHPGRKGRLVKLEVGEALLVEVVLESLADGEAAKAVYTIKRGAEIYTTRDGYVHIYSQDPACPPMNLHFRKDEPASESCPSAK